MALTTNCVIVLHLIYHYHRVRNVMCHGFYCVLWRTKGGEKIEANYRVVVETSKCSDIS